MKANRLNLLGFIGAAILLFLAGCTPDNSSNVDKTMDCFRGTLTSVDSRLRVGNLALTNLKKGVVIEARAHPKDTWFVGSAPYRVTAAGLEDSPGAFESKPPQAPYGALIGWISNCPDKAFLIGSGAEIVAPCDGDLYLAANDNWDRNCMFAKSDPQGCHSDNSGSIRVCLKLKD